MKFTADTTPIVPYGRVLAGDQDTPHRYAGAGWSETAGMFLACCLPLFAEQDYSFSSYVPITLVK